MTFEDFPILLVEDKTTDVLLIRRAFERARLANPLKVVSGGDAAVEYLSGEGPYGDRDHFPMPVLILLDLKLSRRSGLEVLGWLRAQENLKRMPVVMLTSSQHDRDINAAYDIGVNSYLVKPVEFAGLTNMLQQVNLYWLMLNERPRFEGGTG
jgi:CheY-like chemotaxis protein